jgi:hypothetical protein
VLKPRSFSPNRAQKRQERYQLFFGLQLASKKILSFRNPNQNRAALWRIFSSNESAPVRQDSMQTVIRTSKMLDSFFHKVAQNFELLSNIQDQK